MAAMMREMTSPKPPFESHVRFRAMNVAVHIVAVNASPYALEAAQAEVHECEARWSRFLASSELSRINNRHTDQPIRLSAETFELVAASVEAWRATDGRFDPTILPSLRAHGYDTTFAEIQLRGDEVEPMWSPGCIAIELDPVTLEVTLPPGLQLDLSGIAKGHTADRVVGALLATGATGAYANLGGDIRVAGQGPSSRGWIIGVDDPFDGERTICTMAIVDGGIVTSTRLQRQWTRGGETQHHLIDPRTGAPARSGVAAVTVLTATASTAEVLAKAVFVDGLDGGLELLADHGVTGLLVDDEGRVHYGAGVEAFIIA